jgi:DNA-directed RNA polymerase subunit RPC12/RpoP
VELRVGPEAVDSHGICPKCHKRLLLTGKYDEGGKLVIHPLVTDEGKGGGKAFLIEDHFEEVPDPKEKISFVCPCGRRLAVFRSLVDKRVQCPHCRSRLLLVGKQSPGSRRLEIHPLVEDEGPSGDTIVLREESNSRRP